MVIDRLERLRQKLCAGLMAEVGPVCDASRHGIALAHMAGETVFLISRKRPPDMTHRPERAFISADDIEYGRVNECNIHQLRYLLSLPWVPDDPRSALEQLALEADEG